MITVNYYFIIINRSISILSIGTRLDCRARFATRKYYILTIVTYNSSRIGLSPTTTVMLLEQ